jgi:tetratricopeptide (TPR) repeat protein
MRTRTAVAAIVLLSVAVVGLQALEDRAHSALVPEADAADVLYVQSPAVLKRAALSYDALVADLYWIRAVQYYGGKRLSKGLKSYDLLYPLLDLTTSVDPYFDIAYRFGAIFLGEQYPGGAGRPDLGIALLQKGLRAQPDKWQFAEDIGFVYYWWLRDYQSAAEWFKRAGEMPDAPEWLTPLAAVTLAQGGNRTSSRTLWTEILRNADAEWLHRQAIVRLEQLDAMDGIDFIERIVQQYRERTGVLPSSWDEMIRARLLRAVPSDPTGIPLQLDPSTGKVTLDPSSSLNPLPLAEQPR